jgi:uncharacterized protein
MTSYRFLPDLTLQLAALILGLLLFRKSSKRLPWRVAATTSSALLVAGLIVTSLQATDQETGYRWIAASGLSLAWAVAMLGAFMIGFALKTIGSRWLPAPVAPERRRLLTAAAGVAMAAPAAVLASGFSIGRKQFHMEEVDLAVPDLAPDLEGLRLVQLSDIHLSPFLSRAELARCVDMANEARAHVALVTGDLVTGLRDPLDDCLDELKRLRADAGVYGCMGNHETYIRAENYVQHAAAKRGMQFLRHQKRMLQFGGATLNLAGVDHQWKKKTYLAGALALIAPGHLNLLMSHNPDVFPIAAAQGWDVTLAGHLHGGQINVELMHANLNFMSLKTPYLYGTYREGRSAMYVTRGIGTVAMPVRFGAPPEVALIRLRRA